MAKKSKMIDVPRELERAGELCLAFANTAAPRVDFRSTPKSRRRSPSPGAFGNYGELVDWSRRMGALEDVHVRQMSQAAQLHPDAAKAAFSRALKLRASLMRLFTDVAAGKPVTSKDLEVVNGVLGEGLAARRLIVLGDELSLGWGGDASALDRMLWPVACSASDLLLSKDLRWVRQCAGKDCRRLFVDRRSRIRKWCDMNTCGNRPKWKRHHKYRSYVTSASDEEVEALKKQILEGESPFDKGRRSRLT